MKLHDDSTLDKMLKGIVVINLVGLVLIIYLGVRIGLEQYRSLVVIDQPIWLSK